MQGKVAATPYADLRRYVSSGGEQGLLSVAFSPALRDERQALRLLHEQARQRASSGATRRQAAPPRCDPVSRQLLEIPDSRTRTTTAGSSPSGPTATSTSAWATAAARGRPARQRPERSTRCSARSCASTSTAHGRPAVPDPGRQPVRRPRRATPGDLGVRPAQPVALLLRPRDRRPLDRRRRPGRWEEVDHVRGKGARGGINFGWNARGHARLRHEHAARGRQADDAGRRVQPLAGLQPSRRLRLSRHRPSGASAAATSTRTTARAASGRSRPPAGPRATSRASSRRRACSRSPRSARTDPACCTCAPARDRSTASPRADRLRRRAGARDRVGRLHGGVDRGASGRRTCGWRSSSRTAGSPRAPHRTPPRPRCARSGRARRRA